MKEERGEGWEGRGRGTTNWRIEKVTIKYDYLPTKIYSRPKKDFKNLKDDSLFRFLGKVGKDKKE